MRFCIGYCFLILFSCKTTDFHSAPEPLIADFYIEYSQETQEHILSEYYEYITDFCIAQAVSFLKIEELKAKEPEKKKYILLYQENWTENQIQKFRDGLKRTEIQHNTKNINHPTRSGTYLKLSTLKEKGYQSTDWIFPL